MFTSISFIIYPIWSNGIRWVALISNGYKVSTYTRMETEMFKTTSKHLSNYIHFSKTKTKNRNNSIMAITCMVYIVLHTGIGTLIGYLLSEINNIHAYVSFMRCLTTY